MGDRWNGMTEPVSLEDYAAEADRRLRELADRPMDLSELETAPHIAGALHTAAPGDSISAIMGSSDPGAIGAFMQANDLSDTRLRAGQSYLVPELDRFAAPGARALGQAGLNADNALATQRAQRQFDPENGSLATKLVTPPAASEAVTVQATRPGKGEYRVAAYFTNPGNLGGFAGPLPAAHIGFKVYHGDEFLYALDAGPSGFNFSNPGPGQLIFNGTDKNLTSYQPGIEGVKEFGLTPPKGVSGEMFAKQISRAAQDYDGSLPYDFPGLGLNSSSYTSFGQPDPDPSPRFHFQTRMEPGKYNSNAFAAALLTRVGAESNIPELQKYLITNELAAPGLEQPVPQRYFRNR